MKQYLMNLNRLKIDIDLIWKLKTTSNFKIFLVVGSRDEVKRIKRLILTRKWHKLGANLSAKT